MDDQPERDFWARMGIAVSWTLKTLVRLLLAVILIAILAFGVQYGLQLLERRFDQINSRIDLFDSDIATLLESDAGQRADIRSLQSEGESASGQLAAHAGDLTRQSRAISTLEARVAAQGAALDASATDVANLNAGLLALQSDSNDNRVVIDELGGILDSLQLQSTDLDARVLALESSIEESGIERDQVYRTLALFHLWELIGRARVRIVEANPGLAAADAQEALALAALLAESASESDAGLLQLLQLRLTLASDNLPGDPAAAVVDLEAAWQALGEWMTAVLFPQRPAPTATLEATEPGATPAPTQPTATPGT